MKRDYLLPKHYDGKVIGKIGKHSLAFFNKHGDATCATCINDNLSMFEDYRDRQHFIISHTSVEGLGEIVCSRCGCRIGQLDGKM